MANFTADQQYLIDTPGVRSKANRFAGRVRIFHSLFRAPPSGANPAIGDKIIWGKLPTGARILGYMSRLDFSAGTASCTLNLGDNTLATRHLAATSVAAAGTATPNAAVLSSTCAADVILGSDVLANVKGLGACGIGDVLSGTAIPTGAYVTSIDKAARTVTISAAAVSPATLTPSTQTVTASGTAYETTDDGANAANAYTFAYDDCTLISVVAGAQVANNQVISLHIAYVCD